MNSPGCKRLWNPVRRGRKMICHCRWLTLVVDSGYIRMQVLFWWGVICELWMTLSLLRLTLRVAEQLFSPYLKPLHIGWFNISNVRVFPWQSIANIANMPNDIVHIVPIATTVLDIALPSIYPFSFLETTTQHHWHDISKSSSLCPFPCLHLIRCHCLSLSIQALPLPLLCWKCCPWWQTWNFWCNGGPNDGRHCLGPR